MADGEGKSIRIPLRLQRLDSCRLWRLDQSPPPIFRTTRRLCIRFTCPYTKCSQCLTPVQGLLCLWCLSCHILNTHTHIHTKLNL